MDASNPQYLGSDEGDLSIYRRVSVSWSVNYSEKSNEVVLGKAR